MAGKKIQSPEMGNHLFKITIEREGSNYRKELIVRTPLAWVFVVVIGMIATVVLTIVTHH